MAPEEGTAKDGFSVITHRIQKKPLLLRKDCLEEGLKLDHQIVQVNFDAVDDQIAKLLSVLIDLVPGLH